MPSRRDRRDEASNQELARELAEREDQEGIRELVANLRHTDQNVRSDCLKTLYEVGYLRPELIADYAGEFLRPLRDRNNRMAWGSMIALSTIAPLRPDELYPQTPAQPGRNGRRLRHTAPAVTAGGCRCHGGQRRQGPGRGCGSDRGHRAELLPYLFHHLQTCRPKDVPQHAEAIVPAVDAAHAAAFVAVLERRLDNMSAGQAARAKRMIAQARRAAKQVE